MSVQIYPDLSIYLYIYPDLWSISWCSICFSLIFWPFRITVKLTLRCVRVWTPPKYTAGHINSESRVIRPRWRGGGYLGGLRELRGLGVMVGPIKKGVSGEGQAMPLWMALVPWSALVGNVDRTGFWDGGKARRIRNLVKVHMKYPRTVLIFWNVGFPTLFLQFYTMQSFRFLFANFRG